MKSAYVKSQISAEYSKVKYLYLKFISVIFMSTTNNKTKNI